MASSISWSDADEASQYDDLEMLASPVYAQQHQRSFSRQPASYHTPVGFSRSPVAYQAVSHSRSDSPHGEDHSSYGAMSPPLLSSPSIASSFGLSASYMSMNRRSQSTSRGPRHSSPGVNRQDLAKRLTILAQRLTCGDDVDELALVDQVEQMEKAVSAPASPAASPSPSQRSRLQQSPDYRSPMEPNSILSSPVSSMVRSQLSLMSLQSAKDRENDVEEAEAQLENQPKMGMTIQQAKKVIAESTKLNEDLDNVMQNLRARQEEADHINALLIERAERAAQRIIFLQKRIAYLEGELQENDDEVQHLRICLKAVEIQMPPHPDAELRRCINVFKDDYRALKTKRTSRSYTNSANTTQTFSSPITPRPKQAMY